MNPYIIILGASLLVIVSYLIHLLGKKTSIPAVLLLLLLGVIGKQILPVTISNLHHYLSVLGNVGLILIVLEASLDLHIEEDKIGFIFKAFLSALIGLIINIAGISVVCYFIFQTTWLKAMLVAVPFSVMSSAIVIPSVHALRKPDKEFAIYESSISDILGIIFFYLFLDLNQSHSSAAAGILGTTILSVIVTIVFAVVVSYGLIWLFGRIKEKTKLFLILAALMSLFALGKIFHLSSLIIIMVFGLILGNQHLFFKGYFSKIFLRRQSELTAHELHSITLESAFIIKTFFFFLFGFSIELNNLLNLKGFLTGMLILFITYLTRYITIRSLKTKNVNTNLLTTITPRGLISILLFFSIPESLSITGMGDTAMLILILGTNIILTYGLIRYRNHTTTKDESDKLAVVAEPIENTPTSD